MYISEKMAKRKNDMVKDVVKICSPREKKIVDKSTHALNVRCVCRACGSRLLVQRRSCGFMKKKRSPKDKIILDNQWLGIGGRMEASMRGRGMNNDPCVYHVNF